MRLVKFIVSIPKPDVKGEYESFEYSTPDEVCEALNIKKSTMYSMCRGEFRCAQANQKYLDGIKVERIPIPGINPTKDKKSKEDIMKESKEIQKNLLENLKIKKESPI